MENLLPKTWKAKKLADIAQIERGKFTHRPRNDPKFYGGKVPFVQTGDISNSNGQIKEYKQTLNEAGLAISKVFPQGTILITIAANIGYTGILEFDAACPDSLIGITTNNEVSPDFLNFYLMTQQPVMDRLAPRGTQKNINIEFLKPWPVVVPPIAEQKRIAYVLSTVQRAISQQEQIIQITTELKKALMHKLFTEGLYGEKQKESAIGLIPESWEVVRLGDYADFKNGINFAKTEKGQVGILTLDVKNMYCPGCSVNFSDVYRVDKEVDDSYILRNGDLLFVRSSLKHEGIGWTSMFTSSDEPATFCGFIIRARLQNYDCFYSPFLVSYFRTEAARTKMISGGTKVAITNINQGMLKQTLVPKPSLEEQREIANLLSLADKKIESHQAKKDLFRELFRTLLHQLMTAQIRVHDINLPGFEETDSSAALSPH